MLGGSGSKIQMMQHQDDSVTIIANPVSGTKYEWLAGATGAGASLGTQKNVRIISIVAKITWATTQPTPLEAHVTIDGQSLIFAKVNPTTNTHYYAASNQYQTPIAQPLDDTQVAGQSRAFLLEGRSVKVETEITWATTQPTDLTLKVKWAKIP